MGQLVHVALNTDHPDFDVWWNAGGRKLWEEYAPGVEDDEFNIPREQFTDFRTGLDNIFGWKGVGDNNKEPVVLWRFI